MTTFSWNCHGLGTPWALQFLKDQLIQKKPSILFLSETLCRKDKMENVRKGIRFEGAFAVDCQGQGGGITMLWKNKEEVTIQSYGINHIDAKVDIQGWPSFRLTGIYGTNKWVEIRLDRAIATSSWMHLFKDARLINLEASTSDHSPILLVPMAVDGLPRVRKQKFENAWLREPVCISWNFNDQMSFRDWAVKEFNEWCSENLQSGEALNIKGVAWDIICCSVLQRQARITCQDVVTNYAITPSGSFSNETATSSTFGASFLQCPHQGA
ncbi:hypothetical protein POM88_012119 [Heracleum sosnowskyi]|uniref:Endonuclease/exonuclease/phosphatase domain-containing protein n=1 Tax=Heracleum sosnowskyi TaxID=360622 RepID=A0AAD8N325_9APIA|nr:hypothetical protein POM88_012119 [Heracleum sosnowskyi]